MKIILWLVTICCCFSAADLYAKERQTASFWQRWEKQQPQLKKQQPKVDYSVDFLAKGYSPITVIDKFRMTDDSGAIDGIIENSLADGRYLVADGERFLIYRKDQSVMQTYASPELYKVYNSRMYDDNSVVVTYARNGYVNVVHFYPDGREDRFKIKAPIRDDFSNGFAFSKDNAQLIIPNGSEILIVELLTQQVIQRISHNTPDKIERISRNDADGYFKVESKDAASRNEIYGLLTPDGCYTTIKPIQFNNEEFTLRYGQFVGHNLMLAYQFTSSIERMDLAFYDYVTHRIEKVSLATDDLKQNIRGPSGRITSGGGPIETFYGNFLYLVTPYRITVYDRHFKQVIAKKDLPDIGGFKTTPQLFYFPEKNILRVRNIHSEMAVDLMMPVKN